MCIVVTVNPPPATISVTVTPTATTTFTVKTGLPGKSAYQSAVDNGFVGDESAWVASLQGGSESFIKQDASVISIVDGVTSTTGEILQFSLTDNGVDADPRYTLDYEVVG